MEIGTNSTAINPQQEPDWNDILICVAVGFAILVLVGMICSVVEYAYFPK